MIVLVTCMAAIVLLGIGFIAGGLFEVKQTFRKGGAWDTAYNLGREHGARMEGLSQVRRRIAEEGRWSA